jgi:hypothetical protein
VGSNRNLSDTNFIPFRHVYTSEDFSKRAIAILRYQIGFADNLLKLIQSITLFLAVLTMSQMTQYEVSIPPP